jgi:hypothetical protein
MVMALVVGVDVAVEGQGDDGYQESATGVLQHDGGEVSTLGHACWVGEAKSGARHVGEATYSCVQIVALTPLG